MFCDFIGKNTLLFELFKFTETNQLFFIGEMIKIAK
jgi:hypothetical protein